MSKFKTGDLVYFMGGFSRRYCRIINTPGILSCLYTLVDVNNGSTWYAHEYDMDLILKGGQEDMKNDEKELKKDVEILLNIYLQNRDMNKKEIKRFSERHFDIIEKQNAKNTLKRRGK